MPIYGYLCKSCSSEFDELLVNSNDIAEYSEFHPCPNCAEPAERLKVSQFSFSFKGEVTGTSGIHGNSGVHDLDYPTLDKAVARSSEKRWAINRVEQAARDKVRKESGQVAVTRTADGYAPSDAGSLKIRQKAVDTLHKAVKSTSEK